MVLKLSAKACLVMRFSLGGRPEMMPTLAPAEPPLKAAASWGPSAARRDDSLVFMMFWKMTEPTTTETALPMLRMKPKVAVAVAMSRFCRVVSE